MSYAIVTEEIKKKLFEINKNPDLKEKYIRDIDTWNEMYYLHPGRVNILRFLEFDKPGSALEIGGDGGVYTEYLSGIFKNVLCIDSDDASLSLNKIRCNGCENVRLKAGDLSSLKEEGNAGFDLVLIHKGFTEAESYVGKDEPHTSLLKDASYFLNPGGKLILITENRLGMRYFAGVKNRQNGRYFSGLTGYSPSETKISFSKKELTDIFKKAGFKELRFRYPYPDEFFTKCVYSDEYLPKQGELTENIRNFDDERVVLFDEGRAFDTILKENRFPDFSNAFLIEASLGE